MGDHDISRFYHDYHTNFFYIQVCVHTEDYPRMDIIAQHKFFWHDFKKSLNHFGDEVWFIHLHIIICYQTRHLDKDLVSTLPKMLVLSTIEAQHVTYNHGAHDESGHLLIRLRKILDLEIISPLREPLHI